eukprot:2825108-Amphidinium_carterae.4
METGAADAFVSASKLFWRGCKHAPPIELRRGLATSLDAVATGSATGELVVGRGQPDGELRRCWLPCCV